MNGRPWREVAKPHKDVLQGRFKQREFAADIRQLAYHLYTLCERKKWADDARVYNELITAWHAIVAASHETGHRGAQSTFEL